MYYIMFKKAEKNKPGFTLIELLVVIAIIGVTSSMAVVNLNSLRAKARDAKRKSDITNIQKAVEAYNYEHGEYPSLVTCTGLPGIVACTSAIAGTVWIPDMGIDLPVDPFNYQDPEDMTLYLYLYTRTGSSANNHYYLQYTLETESLDYGNCTGGYFASMSCTGGGNMPPDIP